MPMITRREILRLFASAVPAAALACRAGNAFLDEGVCVHVFPPSLALPGPLLKDLGAPPGRRPKNAAPETGLPELLVCATSVPFLRLFPYFWPISQSEFDRCRQSMRLLFSIQTLPSEGEERELERWLSSLRPEGKAGLAGVLTYNEHSRYCAARHLAAFRGAGLPEIVVFKDPTASPYLCDFDAAQRGFRRPPP